MKKLSKIELSLQDLILVERNHLSDERGFFTRLFCANELKVAGWTKPIQQINFTKTKHKGSIRGMHFQKNGHEEAKLVRCIRGEIQDTIIDLRPESTTYLETYSITLNENSNKMIYEKFINN